MLNTNPMESSVRQVCSPSNNTMDVKLNSTWARSVSNRNKLLRKKQSSEAVPAGCMVQPLLPHYSLCTCTYETMQMHIETALFLTINCLPNASAPNKQVFEGLCTACSAALFSSVMPGSLVYWHYLDRVT